jgi:phosphinothricin acetyltransferase
MGSIRDARSSDVVRICEIYNHYVMSAVATFEEDPVSAAEMEERLRNVQRQFWWLVYEVDGRVVGYAYASAWKTRAAYRYSVESSVYIDPAFHGRGIGKALYERLLANLRTAGMHTVIGGVAGDNEGSIQLHRSMGFAEVARLREVGFKFGQWIDVTYFQLQL